MPFGTLSTEGKAIPAFAPPYTSEGIFHFSGMTIIGVAYRVDAKDVLHLIPKELEMDDEPLMVSYFVDYGMSTVGSYTEFVQSIEVRYKGETFMYSVILILDNDTAIFPGREVFGYPKVHGKTNIRMNTGSDTIIGNVERPAGRTLVDFEFVPEKPLAAAPMPEMWQLNLRSIPPIQAGQTAVRQLIPVKMDAKFDEVWSGRASLKFTGGSLTNPWAEVNVLRYEGAFMGRAGTAVVRLRGDIFNI